jgi:hypothetical protein
MPTTWSNINDSQGASWDDVKSFGYLLLESGAGDFLVQEAALAPFNKFIINVPLPSQVWASIDDTQGATWAAINNSQGATWSNVNDTQGAVWTPVNVST